MKALSSGRNGVFIAALLASYVACWYWYPNQLAIYIVVSFVGAVAAIAFNFIKALNLEWLSKIAEYTIVFGLLIGAVIVYIYGALSVPHITSTVWPEAVSLLSLPEDTPLPKWRSGLRQLLFDQSGYFTSSSELPFSSDVCLSLQMDALIKGDIAALQGTAVDCQKAAEDHRQDIYTPDYESITGQILLVFAVIGVANKFASYPFEIPPKFKRDKNYPRSQIFGVGSIKYGALIVAVAVFEITKVQLVPTAAQPLVDSMFWEVVSVTVATLLVTIGSTLIGTVNKGAKDLIDTWPTLLKNSTGALLSATTNVLSLSPMLLFSTGIVNGLVAHSNMLISATTALLLLFIAMAAAGTISSLVSNAIALWAGFNATPLPDKPKK